MDRSFLLSRYDKYIFVDILLTGSPDILYWFNCYDKMVWFHTTASNFGAGEKVIT